VIVSILNAILNHSSQLTSMEDVVIWGEVIFKTVNSLIP